MAKKIFAGSRTDPGECIRQIDILQDRIRVQEKSISQYKDYVRVTGDQLSELTAKLIQKEEAIELMREAIGAQRETINALQARGCK